MKDMHQQQFIHKSNLQLYISYLSKDLNTQKKDSYMPCKGLGLSQPFADVVLHYTFLLLCLPTKWHQLSISTWNEIPCLGNSFPKTCFTVIVGKKGHISHLLLCICRKVLKTAECVQQCKAHRVDLISYQPPWGEQLQHCDKQHK